MKLRRQIQPPKRYDDYDEAEEIARRSQVTRNARGVTDHAPTANDHPNPQQTASPSQQSPTSRKSKSTNSRVDNDGTLSSEKRRIKSSTQPTSPSRRTKTTKTTKSAKTPTMPSYSAESNARLRDGLRAASEEIGGGRQGNGPANPVWASNMGIIDKMANRTDEDWLLAEMETSDEEEIVENQPTDCPQWDDISPALQVDLVRVLTDELASCEKSMRELRLTSTQMQRVQEHLQNEEICEAEENARIAALQNVTNQLLLAGDGTRVRHMSQAKFHQLAEEHLFQSAEENYCIASWDEIAKAKNYLQACGHRPELLDHWNDPLRPSTHTSVQEQTEDPRNTVTPTTIGSLQRDTDSALAPTSRRHKEKCPPSMVELSSDVTGSSLPINTKRELDAVTAHPTSRFRPAKQDGTSQSRPTAADGLPLIKINPPQATVEQLPTPSLTPNLLPPSPQPPLSFPPDRSTTGSESEAMHQPRVKHVSFNPGQPSGAAEFAIRPTPRSSVAMHASTMDEWAMGQKRHGVGNAAGHAPLAGADVVPTATVHHRNMPDPVMTTSPSSKRKRSEKGSGSTKKMTTVDREP